MQTRNVRAGNTQAKSARHRQSLPAGTVGTPSHERVTDARQHNTIPRFQPPRNASSGTLGRSSGAMPERLFSTQSSAIPATRQTDSSGTRTVIDPATSKDQQENMSVHFETSIRAPTNPLAFGDEVDEISILGMDFQDALYDNHSRPQTPDKFIDDISFKLESPGNLSIGRFFDDVENLDGRVSPTQEMQRIKSESTPTEAVEGDQVSQVPSNATPAEIAPTSPSRHPDSSRSATPEAIYQRRSSEGPADVGAIPENNNGDQVPATPEKLQNQLPFANVDQINTPARPVEDYALVHLDLEYPAATSQKSQTSHQVLPNLDKSEGTESQDKIVESKLTAVRIDFENVADNLKVSSPGNGVEQPTSNDTLATPGGGTMLTHRSVDTTIEHVVLQTPVLSRLNDSAKKLGSAIRLSSVPDKTAVATISTTTTAATTSRINGIKRSRLDLSTPIAASKSRMIVSEPLIRPKRILTPPPRTRLSMDVPLSRAAPSIELWENSDRLVRQQMSRSPTPEPLSAAVLSTPPPKERLSMDVPLSRAQEPKEQWQDEGHLHRSRRSLISPQPRRRSLQSAPLIVDESPQLRTSLSASASQNDDYVRELPKVPKLDFGVSTNFKNATSLSDDDDDVASQTPSSANRLTVMLNDSELMDAAPKSLSKISRTMLPHATPKSSKLRLLARKLTEIERDHEDTEQEPESTEFAPEAEIIEDDMHRSSPEVEHQPHSRSESDLTPRSARRKELSDDISLDFADEVIVQSTTLDDAIQDGVVSQSPATKSGETNDSTGVARAAANLGIATPVFTIKRKFRAATDPREKSPEQHVESLLQEVVLSQPSPAIQNKLTRVKVIKPILHVEKQLATFGKPPPELHRSRRERKKPAEFWKINSHSSHNEDRHKSPPVHHAKSKHGDGKQKKVARKDTEGFENITVIETTLENIIPLEPPKKIESSKRHKRKRPSEFAGPVSKHQKVTDSSALSRPSGTAFRATIPARSHDFEHSD